MVRNNSFVTTLVARSGTRLIPQVARVSRIARTRAVPDETIREASPLPRFFLLTREGDFTRGTD